MELFILDIALRGASTGIFILFVPLIWAGRITREAKLAFTATTIFFTARLWSTLPPGYELADTATGILRFIGTGAAFAGTWFLITIFLDSRRFFAIWLLSGAAVSIGIIVAISVPVIVPYLRAYAVAHFCALTVLIIASARGDLMDARRRIRPVLCLVLLLFSINDALTSNQIIGEPSAAAALGKAIPLFVVLMLLALWSLKANVNNWPGEVTPRTPSEPIPGQITPAQTQLVQRIEAAMAAGIWRNEGLTIGTLAQEVDAPEHRVRKAINQVLGHRNFSSFINQSRIAEAKRRLRAPEDAEATVLEIAYSVGFGSLGPFNRAFRETTQQSPSEYRNGPPQT